MTETVGNREDGAESGARAVLVGAGEPRHMEELGRLATTLGMEVVGVLEQGRRDNAGYLGRGKREELGGLVEEVGAGFVVTDDELTASQARVLERAAGAVVVDRTELIIRIFEVHAGDAASSLEVELADLQYRLPRVKGRNPELSRLGGGRGGAGGGARRGSGEQQLEYDRRVIRERIDTINRKLRREKTARGVRGARLRGGTTPTVALVGYTNAGKTTILNALSGAGRSTKDRLFETLETTTRLVQGGATGNGVRGAHPDFVVTDTVGFIRKLPTQLVHSFASTLEAANQADVRVLCADASILCLNKMDLVPEGRASELRRLYPEAVRVTAARSEVGPLLDAIYESISQDRERMEVLIPHEDYGAASRLYGLADIHARRTTEEGLWMDVSLPRSASARYAPYKVPKV